MIDSAAFEMIAGSVADASRNSDSTSPNALNVLFDAGPDRLRRRVEPLQRLLGEMFPLRLRQRRRGCRPQTPASQPPAGAKRHGSRNDGQPKPKQPDVRHTSTLGPPEPIFVGTSEQP